MSRRFASLFAALMVVITMALPQAASAQTVAPFYREVVFADAQVVTIDATSGAAGVTGFAPATLAAFQASCTEDSGTATMDITIQKSIDGGTTWSTVVAFTQMTATASETKLYADVRAASAQMISNRLRADFNIGGTGQYTCTVVGAFEN